jgi:hypothetical protein
MSVGYDSFCKYDADNMKAEPILYQSGYLTITGYNEETEEFILDYPNTEVRSAFSKFLLEHYLQSCGNEASSLISILPKALIAGNIEEAMNSIRQFLASIPYDIIENREKYFQTAIHLIFSMFGLNCRSEVRIASGRIDTLVETKNFVYCFEFKLDKTSPITAAAKATTVAKALEQINSKEYLLPWEGSLLQSSQKKLFKIGVSFDYEKRNIDQWLVSTEPG